MRLVVGVVGIVALGCGRIGFDSTPPVLDAPPDVALACDVFEQTGCPGGEACYFDQQANTRCAIAGTGANSSPCNDTLECVPKSTCVVLSPGSGACTSVCRDAADCAFGNCLDAGFAGVGACEIECDPTTHDGCFERCYLFPIRKFPSGATINGATFCGPPRGLDEGAACTTALDCGPGLTCAQDVCRPLCVVGSPQCPAPLACATFDPIVMRFGKTLGVCVM